MISSQSEGAEFSTQSNDAAPTQDAKAEVDGLPPAENIDPEKDADSAAKKAKAAKKSQASVGRKSSNNPKSGSTSSQNVVIATIPGSEDHTVKAVVGTAVAIAATHRGIGDNSRNADTVIDEDANSAAEHEAVLAIAAFNAATVESAIHLRPYTRDALAKLYAIVQPIVTEGRFEAFCEAHQISVHGNTGNICQPVVAHYFHPYHQPHVRQAVSRFAMIHAVAIHDGIQPTQFPDWLEHGGLQKIVARYKALKKPNRAPPAKPDYGALARLALADPSTVPVVKGSSVTAGHSGFRLIAADLHNSGSGDFIPRAVLPLETDEVERIVGEVVLKKLKSTK